MNLPPHRQFAPCGVGRRTAARRRHVPGFTLIELLVVIAVVAILLALLVPALQAARRTAHGVMCMSTLRSIHVASLTYGSDFRAIPAGRSFETELSSPQASKFPRSWYVSVVRPWTYGPAFTTMNMALGYLPRDKEAAWCPAADRGSEISSVHFWGREIEDRFWGLSGSPYAASGFRFLSHSTSPAADQYYTGGAVPIGKWDRYPRAFFATEVEGASTVTNSIQLDGYGKPMTRHGTTLNVLFPAGHVAAMPRDTIAQLIASGDPEFLWGE